MTPQELCYEAAVILAEFVPGAELWAHKGNDRSRKWELRCVNLDVSPKSLALAPDEYRQTILRPAIVELAKMLPKKVRFLCWRVPNPAYTGELEQIAYNNVMPRLVIYGERATVGVLVNTNP